MRLPSFVSPACFRWFYKSHRDRSFDFLDVGCGNHAVQKAKKWFPNCSYTGLDRDRYNNDDDDFNRMEHFHQVDLEQVETLEVLPDKAYDIVVMVHVIEHLKNGEDVVGSLCRKLRAGGGIYIEFPAVESLALPSMEGTLNFCDDPTHVKVYDVRELSNQLLEMGFTIKYAGRRRHPLLFVLAPVLIVLGIFKNRRVTAFGFWDLAHFADCIYAIKSPEVTEQV